MYAYAHHRGKHMHKLKELESGTADELARSDHHRLLAHLIVYVCVPPQGVIIRYRASLVTQHHVFVALKIMVSPARRDPQNQMNRI